MIELFGKYCEFIYTSYAKWLSIWSDVNYISFLLLSMLLNPASHENKKP